MTALLHMRHVHKIAFPIIRTLASISGIVIKTCINRLLNCSCRWLIPRVGQIHLNCWFTLWKRWFPRERQILFFRVVCLSQEDWSAKLGTDAWKWHIMHWLNQVTKSLTDVAKVRWLSSSLGECGVKFVNLIRFTILHKIHFTMKLTFFPSPTIYDYVYYMYAI